MKKLIFFTSLNAAFIITLSRPMSAEEVVPIPLAIPSEVKGSLPTGIESFLIQSAPIGPQGSEMLIHVWAAPRSNIAESLNRYTRYTVSPFCIDVFARKTNQDTRPSWRLISSAGYMATDPPILIETHWLEPGKKRGPIIEIVSRSGAPGIATSHTLFMWEKGFAEGSASPSPQQFFSGGMGGGTLTQSLKAVDQRGFTIVESVDSYVGRVRSVAVHKWNGKRFEQVQSKTTDMIQPRQ